MKHAWLKIVAAMLPTLLIAQTARRADTQTAQAPGPFTRIAMMHALEGHAVNWEAGYVRHLEWHRQAQDTFKWYSYSVWASTERQQWIIYATFGHTAVRTILLCAASISDGRPTGSWHSQTAILNRGRRFLSPITAPQVRRRWICLVLHLES